MIGSVVRTALLAMSLAAYTVVLPGAGLASPEPTQLVAPPTAVTSPTSAPAIGLREIGRIHVTSPLCKVLVSHAVHAIDIVTANDRRLDVAEKTLLNVDLDSSELAKHRGVSEIVRQYVELRAAAVDGNGVMGEFRSDALAVASDEQRAHLVTFGDALDGALHRQKTLADAMGRLIAYLGSHPPIDRATHDQMIFEELLRESDRRQARDPFARAGDGGPLAGIPDPLSLTARFASAELVKRAASIAGDEDAAATRMDDAFASC